MALILAYAERDGIKRYNSALVFDSDGAVLGKYRKVHIPAYFPSNLPGGTGSYERLYFTPGDLGFPTFDLKGVGARIGVQICYDRMFLKGIEFSGLRGRILCLTPRIMPRTVRRIASGYGEDWCRVGHMRMDSLSAFPIKQERRKIEKIRGDLWLSIH